MRLFCNIHETNYDPEKGCPLWGKNDWEHKAKRNCLPPKNHYVYRFAEEIRKANSYVELKKFVKRYSR